MAPGAQVIYWGLATLAPFALAKASGSRAAIKVSLLLVVAWSVSNVALQIGSYANEPHLVPMLDAIIATGVVIVGIVENSRLALAVFALYVLLGVVHVYVNVFHPELSQSIPYYFAKNAIYGLQLLFVGSVSGYLIVRRWRALGYHGDDRHPAGG